MSLEGKVAVVSGASREIGAAMAAALGADGAAVLLSHHGEAELAEVAAEAVRAAGARAAVVEADLSQVDECRRLVAEAVARFGRVDILAANAGVTRWGAFLDADEDDWNFLINLNLRGAFFCAQAAARQMVAQGGGGRIVFTSSVTGLRAAGNGSIYGVTKAALLHVARTAAFELGRHRITVNALALGATLNARNLADDPHYAEHWAELTPTGRVGLPEDAAAALRFLASDAAAHITGQTIVVDGGWTLRGATP